MDVGIHRAVAQEASEYVVAWRFFRVRERMIYILDEHGAAQLVSKILYLSTCQFPKVHVADLKKRK